MGRSEGWETDGIDPTDPEPRDFGVANTHPR